MRRLRLGIGVLAVALAGAALLPASAQTPGPDVVGAFGAPFREDGFAADRETTAGCRKKPGGGYDCLPTAATSVVLSNGRVLYWNALEGTENVVNNAVIEGADQTVNDRTRVLQINNSDPASSTWIEPTPGDGGANPDGNKQSDVGSPSDAAKNDGDLFCADEVQLVDGRVLAVGGTDYYNDPRINETTGAIELEGLKNARIFDPDSNTWSQTGSMSFGRWYPSIITLADGRILATSGVTKLIKPLYTDEKNRSNSGGNVRQLETYDVASGKWTLLPATANRSLPLYPRIHLLPSGNVFFDAAGQAYNPFGQSYDEALWHLTTVFNPKTNTWRDLGVPGIGTSTEPGFRGSTFSAMLPLVPPYDKASFLTAGGVLMTTPGSVTPTGSSRITTVSIAKDGTESMTSTVTGALSVPRWYSSGVPLPDGSVLALSGADLDEVISPGGGKSIRGAELFTPDGKGSGTWKKVETAKQERTYHNTAVLLPDARVLVGGHAPIPNGYGKVETTEGNSNNSRDASFEIYSPPYLFWGPRPEIGKPSDSTLDYGQTVTIPTKDAATIDNVVLVRNTTITHLKDSDQRTVEIPIVSRTANSLEIAIPEQAAVLPSGPYLLFANKGTERGRIPSVAAQVFVGAGASGAPASAATPVRSAPLPATGPTVPAFPALLVIGLAAIVARLVRRPA